MLLRKLTISICILLLSASLVIAQNATDRSVNMENSFYSSTLREDNRIELYPNPAVDYLIVEISNSSLHNAKFELHSIIGNKIRIHPEEIGQNRYRIPLKEFSSGYYFLVVKDEFSRFKKAYKFLKN